MDRLRAFELDVMEENRRRLAPASSTRQPFRGRTWAPTAPMPKAADECRWCHCTLRALVDGEPADYCQRGCAKNDIAPFTADCADCGRQFETGEHRATLCFKCWEKDQAQGKVISATTPRFQSARKDNAKWAERRREQREAR